LRGSEVMFKFYIMAVAALMNAQAAEDPKFSMEQEIACLATNIYWEARNQPTPGQIAVGLTTMNRVDDKRYPNTVCQVVMQGPTRPSWKNPEVLIPIRHKCQFSWFCDGKSDEIPPQDEELYELLLAMSFKLYHYKFQDFTDGATHYHADYVFPEWRFTKTRTIEIEDHIFYRWEK